ncbi:acyltransferase family protein [Rhodobacteraceae bacterium DSL-40]|uniref:acyltransferase family protein n=1 Tax=Amaricoccus sp. B4 TaxID=3368557 RepID=UPI0013A6E7D1
MSEEKLKYRPEIDGLRAISVISVIIFHAGFSAPRGGFLGVDIFFVISGFLITTIIINDLDSGGFSFLKFYERRARRILPALIVVTLCCLPFAWLWLLPEDMKNFSQSLVGVATFTSNVIFWRETGYFDTAADLKPMLHTWSLAVEEQYYIIFPIIMILIFRLGRRFASASLIAMFVVSLAGAEWAAYNAPSANFYLLPTRGWELLIGSFSALYLHNRRRRSRHRIPAAIAEIFGLLMIGIALFVYTKDTPHPSAYTLLPTLGAALIIIFSRPGSPVQRILGSRLLAGIGLISYSLYLWHFPVFAFYRYRTSSEPSEGPWLVLIAAIVALSYLSWKYVETPFRNRQRIPRRVVFAGSVVSLAAIAVLGGGGQLTHGYAFRPQMQAVAINTPTVRMVNCFNAGMRNISQIEAGDICTVGGSNIHTAIIGDSHAGALIDAIGDMGKGEGAGFWTFSDAYCAPAIGFVLNKYGSGCDAKRRASFEKIVENKDVSNVILVANWGIYTQGWRDKLSPSAATLDGVRYEDTSRNPELLKKALDDTVAYLKANGKNVYIVGPVPEFPAQVYPFVEKSNLFRRPINPDDLAVTRSDYDKRNAEAFAILSQINGVHLIPIQDLFCDSKMCRAISGTGTPLFSDTNHVNRTGADMVAALVLQAMDGARMQ